MNKKQKKMLRRILIAAVLMIVLHFAAEAYGDTVHEPVWFLLYLVPYLTVGYDILLKAGKGIKNRQVFDENFLMAVATVGAIAIALINKSETAFDSSADIALNDDVVRVVRQLKEYGV